MLAGSRLVKVPGSPDVPPLAVHDRERGGAPDDATGAAGTGGLPDLDRALTRARRLAFALVMLGLALVFQYSGALAQDALLQANPPPNTLVISPPTQIDLLLANPVDPTAPAPTLSAIGPDGAVVESSFIQISPVEPRQVTAVLAAPLTEGTWTIAWSARIGPDGAPVAGTYAFRVAAPVTPGAATLDGEWPSWLTVLTHWLVLLGGALAAGAFLIAALAGKELVPPSLLLLGAGGATLAVLATLAEPFVRLSLVDAAVAPTPGLGEMFAEMGLVWWAGLAAFATLALITLGLLATGLARRGFPAGFAWGSLVVALIGLAATALAQPAPDGSGLEPTIAAVLNVVQRWSIALCGGGLAALGFYWINRRHPVTVASREWTPDAGVSAVHSPVEPDSVFLSASRPTQSGETVLSGDTPVARRPLIATSSSRPAPPVGAAPIVENAPLDPVTRRFAVLALPLAVIALLTTLLLGGAILSNLSNLLGSLPGILLTVVIVLLVLALVLTGVLWRSTRRAGTRPAGLVWAGASLLEIALLTIALLALLPLPGAALSPTLAGVHLAAAVPIGQSGNEAGQLRVALDPALPGENTLTVQLVGGNGAPLPPTNAPMLEVVLTPLDHDAPEVTVNPIPDASGGSATARVSLPGSGWWQAVVTALPADGKGVQMPYYFVLPDPNVTGRGPTPGSDPAARAIYERGMAAMRELRSVRYTQRLGDGGGSLFQSSTEVTDARDGKPEAFSEITDNGTQLIVIGPDEWVRRAGIDWEQRAASSLVLPSTWADTYVDARGFRLGPVQTVDGEPCQVVTFYLKRTPRTAPAWFAWWVGQETGEVRQEAMVSTRHYMVYSYGDFNTKIEITPPALAPAASPASGTPVADSGDTGDIVPASRTVNP